MARTVLIVDDEAPIRQLLANLIERDGYAIFEAGSGEEAIALANRHRVDAFLLDMQMPRMSGIQICRALRAIEDYKATPIIFVTGQDENTGLEEAFTSGADDFITKPFNPLVLRARLRGHLERMEYFRKLQRSQLALKQYLSRRNLEVVETAASTGILPPPEERDIAICFTDLRGFTALAEDMDPSQLFALVSSLLAEQVEIVHRHSGYVDKFGGDGVMAIFDGPDMVVQSCLCALRIIDSARLKDSTDLMNIRRFGIGIHTGRAVIGNIGSPDHLDYSAIGKTVNLAARLCGQAEATSVVVSKAVRDSVGNESRLHFHNERQVQVRGIKEPVTVYTLSRPGN
jgi:adenylate cyclase